MRITPDILIGAYEFLRTTPPFRGWRLPHADSVEFRVINKRGVHGWYMNGWSAAHRIDISEPRHEHTITVLMTMAHEMVHLHQHAKGLVTGHEHNTDFYRRARRVCNIHGWDFAVF